MFLCKMYKKNLFYNRERIKTGWWGEWVFTAYITEKTSGVELFCKRNKTLIDMLLQENNQLQSGSSNSASLLQRDDEYFLEKCERTIELQLCEAHLIRKPRPRSAGQTGRSCLLAVYTPGTSCSVCMCMWKVQTKEEKDLKKYLESYERDPERKKHEHVLNCFFSIRTVLNLTRIHCSLIFLSFKQQMLTKNMYFFFHFVCNVIKKVSPSCVSECLFKKVCLLYKV